VKAVCRLPSQQLYSVDDGDLCAERAGHRFIMNGNNLKKPLQTYSDNGHMPRLPWDLYKDNRHPIFSWAICVAPEGRRAIPSPDSAARKADEERSALHIILGRTLCKLNTSFKIDS